MVLNLKRICGSRALSLAAAAALLGMGSSVAHAQSVQVSCPTGAAGQTVQLAVAFTAAATNTATGLTIDVGFSGHPVGVASNKPDCIYDPALKSIKSGSGFSFRPAGCTVGTNCSAVRAGIIDFGDNNATLIPTGALYTCNFTIPEGSAEGSTFQFTVDKASFIIPDGTETDITSASTGCSVNVGAAASPTPTATSTPAVTATHTPVPGTNTPTKKPTSSGGGGGGGDDDGCQVVASGSSSAGWLLLIPAAVLLLQRRRSR
jgi:hypothetical protein